MWHGGSTKKALIAMLAISMTSLPGSALAKNLCLQTSDGLDVILQGFKVHKGKSFAVNGWASRVFNQATRIQHQPLSGQAIATSDGRQVAMGLTIYGPAIINPINPRGPAQGCCALLNEIEVLTVDLEADANGRFASAMARTLVTGMRVGPFGGVQLVPLGDLKVFDCNDLGDFKLP